VEVKSLRQRRLKEKGRKLSQLGRTIHTRRKKGGRGFYSGWGQRSKRTRTGGEETGLFIGGKGFKEGRRDGGRSSPEKGVTHIRVSKANSI